MASKSATELRLFLGVALPREMRRNLEAFAMRHAGLPGIRWTAPENLHLTAFFLGNVAPEMLPNLLSLLQVALRGIAPFELRFSRFRLAPKTRDPHMIWAQFEKQENWLQLVRQIDELYAQIQAQALNRRGPIPHITLARLKPGFDTAALEFPPSLRPESLPIRQLVLWQSLLLPEGTRYRVVQRFDLQANFPEKSG